MLKDFSFAWDGASHPEGPWSHLRVLEVRGKDAMSSLYEIEIELVRLADAPDVDIEDLTGRRATLRIATGTTPAFRVIHGIIASAEELGDVAEGGRYRVILAPPLLRASMMRKSLIYVDKTLQDIIEKTLTRASWGAGLLPSSGEAPEDDGDATHYTPAKATYTWRVLDMSRLADPEARPYCVQYEETDVAFVSRLLEEEGVSYHFEHTRDECVLVLSDLDRGRAFLPEDRPLGQEIPGREISHVRAGSRVRPISASLNDFNWRKPELNLLSISPAGVTEFQTHEHPGRYEHSKRTGERLAAARQGRLDTERAWVVAEARCRFLGAGTVFRLEHSNAKFNGRYLVTSIRFTAIERGGFSNGSDASPGDDHPYRAEIECLRCGRKGAPGESGFRPERVTPRPRIAGSQTAIVTAEPSAPDAEINVGGPENIGCVRVRFHWDLDSGRLEKEPSSTWIRVSQMFAGGSHGALWHPRVGHEVIVDYLDGDPDRPIITGRVYNGVNLPPENPTQRPTYSAIKSLTSPHDGNYNMMAFEDAAGKEQIIFHAARDMDIDVTRSSTRSVGNDDATTVGGSQSVSVAGGQSTTAGTVSTVGGTTVSIRAGSDLTASAGANLVGSAGANMSLGAAGNTTVTAGSNLALGAPVVEITGEGNLNAGAPWIDIRGGSKVRAGAPLIEANGATVLINGSGAISIQGGEVTISGSTVNITGGGDVNVKGGVINFNS